MGTVIQFGTRAPKVVEKAVDTSIKPHTYEDLINVLQFYTHINYKKDVVETALKCLKENVMEKRVHPVLPEGLAYLYSSAVKPNAVELLKLTSPDNPYLDLLTNVGKD